MGKRNAVIDLLGLLSYGQLVAFDSIANDAKLAPDLRKRALLSQIAAAEVQHYQSLADRLAELGVDPRSAMKPFVTPIDEFHSRTRPNDWLEGLVKAYIGDGFADDFYREVAEFLDDEDRTVVQDVLHDTRLADYAVAEVRSAIEKDPARGDELALWARRLVGEAVSQAQRVAAERDALTELVVEGSGSLTGVGQLLKRLTVAHTKRLAAMGLSN
ncbi:MAG: hydroxylase [Corynebacteriales bacterium]|nr:hydroxylase [Mycobacteriales bacterium]